MKTPFISFLVLVAALLLSHNGLVTVVAGLKSTRRHQQNKAPAVLEFTAVYGSCNHQDKSQQHWNTMYRTAIASKVDPVADEKIDLLLLLGDIVYHDKLMFSFDFPIPWFHSYRVSLDEMQSNWDRQFNAREYQNFLHYTTKVIGTYDDHDLGFNDVGKYWPDQEESQRMLLDFLQVPRDAATPEDVVRRSRKGVYAFHKLPFSEVGSSGDVGGGAKKSDNMHICMVNLDGRTFRDDPAGDGSGDMLGDAQWKWLEHVLKFGEDPDVVPAAAAAAVSSSSSNNNKNKNNNKVVSSIDDVCAVTFVTSGVQVLGDSRIIEGWGEFPACRDKLLRTLVRSGAHRFVILTGDTHFAEVNVLRALPFKNQAGGSERCGESPFRHLGQDLYDITASSFNRPNSELMFPNHRQVNGPDYQTPNFGLVKVACADPSSVESCHVRVSIHDASTGAEVLFAEPQFFHLRPPPDFLAEDQVNCADPSKFPERYTLPTYFPWLLKFVMGMKLYIPGLFYSVRLDVLFLLAWIAAIVFVVHMYLVWKLTTASGTKVKVS